jgi:phage tail-like protein
MTYTRSRPTLLPRLDSLNLPENGSVDQQILLTPGQVAEVAIQIDNPSRQDWQWQIAIEGNLPTQWSLWDQATQLELPAHSQRSQNISFLVPAHYFEQACLTANQPKLAVNYESQIAIYVQREEQRYLIAYQTFEILLRSPCTYLDFLPDVYRESDFIGQFLNIFEQAFDPAVQTLDTLWAYLDPLTAPRALLPFLAHWVAWEMSPRWTLKQQRRLIRNAVQLYRWRGTRHGLRLYLHLFTGLPLDEDRPESQKRISILESFQTGFVIGQARFDQNPAIGGGRPYHFDVILRPDSDHTIDPDLVNEIIQTVKPAFCTYKLEIL